MAYNTQFIYPTSVYGQISDSYGLPTYPSSSNPSAGPFPQGSGLVLGQFGTLFDGTICRLFKAAGNIAQYAAVTYQINNGNDYTVQTSTATTVYILAANDRGGSTALVTGGVNWMTCYGLGTILVASGQTAPVGLSASGIAGVVTGETLNTSPFNNVLLLNSTTTAGAYPVRFT